MKDNFDNELKAIVTKMHELELDNIPCLEELKEKYVLSDVFYRKMDNLAVKVTQKRNIGFFIKYVSMAAAIMILIWGLANPTIVLDAYEEVIQWFEEHTSFQFKQDAGEIVVPEYEVGYVPQGYELELEEYDGFTGTKIYRKEEKLLIIDYGPADGNINLDSEGKTYHTIKGNKNDTIYYFESKDDNKMSTMTWLPEDEDVVFNVIGYLSKDELLQVHENIREKNKK